MRENNGFGVVIEESLPEGLPFLRHHKRWARVDFRIMDTDDYRALSYGARAAYTALAYFINQETQQWAVTIREIAELLGASHKHTQRLLTELVEAGFVHRQVRRFSHRSGGVHQLENNWTLLMPPSLRAPKEQLPLLQGKAAPNSDPCPVQAPRTEQNREAGPSGLPENDGSGHSFEDTPREEPPALPLQESNRELELQAEPPPPPDSGGGGPKLGGVIRTDQQTDLRSSPIPPPEGSSGAPPSPPAGGTSQGNRLGTWNEEQVRFLIESLTVSSESDPDGQWWERARAGDWDAADLLHQAMVRCAQPKRCGLSHKPLPAYYRGSTRRRSVRASMVEAQRRVEFKEMSWDLLQVQLVDHRRRPT